MCHSKRRMRGDDNATHVGKARWRRVEGRGGGGGGERRGEGRGGGGGEEGERRREEGEEGWLGHMGRGRS